jgi:hypothetical protein
MLRRLLFGSPLDLTYSYCGSYQFEEQYQFLSISDANGDLISEASGWASFKEPRATCVPVICL